MPFPYNDFREWLADEEKLGEVVRIKTPIKCGDPNSIVDAVPADVREENIRIGNVAGAAGKQMETELKAVEAYLHTLPKCPIAVIEQPVNNRPDVPVIINPWSTRERVLRMCGCQDKEQFVRKFKELRTNLIPPVTVDKKDAPVKEVVITEEEIDLYQDIPRCWVEFENNSYGPTGGGQWIVFDPETGTHDLGEWRIGLFDWDNGDTNKPMPEERRKKCMHVTLGFKGGQSSDGGRFYAKGAEQNKPMPAAYAMCSDPSMVVTAAARESLVWPEEGVDEYAAHGGFRGAPVEVVESETIPGLMVPAHAEYVIEGEFLPNEHYNIPMYGEGYFQGYLLGGATMTVFRIKCITHRKKPMWCPTWSSSTENHESVHSTVTYLPWEAEAINFLRQSGYNVKDVVSYDISMIVVQTNVDGLEKKVAHYGMTLLHTLYGCPTRFIGNSNKYYIVVGPDINPYDLRDVIWALNTRSSPVSDSLLIERGCCSWGDPTGTSSALNRHRKTYGEQMFIDALIKVPERYDEYPPRTDPVSWQKTAAKQIKNKIETG